MFEAGDFVVCVWFAFFFPGNVSSPGGGFGDVVNMQRGGGILRYIWQGL